MKSREEKKEHQGHSVSKYKSTFVFCVLFNVQYFCFVLFLFLKIKSSQISYLCFFFNIVPKARKKYLFFKEEEEEESIQLEIEYKEYIE